MTARAMKARVDYEFHEVDLLGRTVFHLSILGGNSQKLAKRREIMVDP